LLLFSLRRFTKNSLTHDSCDMNQTLISNLNLIFLILEFETGKNKILKNGEIPTYARYGKSSSLRKPSFTIGLFFDILENMIFGISRVGVLTNTWFVVLVGER